MGSKAEYEARKAAKRAARDEADRFAYEQRRDAVAARLTRAAKCDWTETEIEFVCDDDEKAYDAAGVARAIGWRGYFYARDDALAAAIMHMVFPKQAAPAMAISYGVVTRPGRMVLREWDIPNDADEDRWRARIGGPLLQRGEVVGAALLAPRGRDLHSIAFVECPRLILPDDLIERPRAVPHWAGYCGGDGWYEFYLPVGEVIYG